MSRGSLKLLEVWYLKDIENFCNRKIKIYFSREESKRKFYLCETRKTDDTQFDDLIEERLINSVLKREKTKIIKIEYPEIKYNNWIYGINKEIKNRKGKIIEIRQYSTEYGSGNKDIVKKIKV